MERPEMSDSRPQSGREADRTGSSAVRSALKVSASMLSTESGSRKKESQGQESYSLGVVGSSGGGGEDSVGVEVSSKELLRGFLTRGDMTRLGTAETDTERDML